MYTSKQRVLAAVNHAPPTDRVPITFDAEKEVYDALHDHLHTTTKEQLFDHLHVDTWMILPENYFYLPGHATQQTKTAIWGYQNKVTAFSGGTYDELCYSPLAGKDDLADIDRHTWPADDTLDFSAFSDQIAAHNDRAIIAAATWGTFFIACYVRSMENLMLDFALNKNYVRHLFDTITERVLFFLDRMLDSAGDGIDIVYMADDYCSQSAPLFSPAVFKELVMPYLSAVVEKTHQHNKKFLLHVCGAVRPLLPMIIDAGVDMLEPIQTRAEGMEPKKLKTDFGNHICFYGGLDLQQTLCKATPQEVADQTRYLIDTLSQNGGYIFGPGHTYIQIDAPLKNIITMYQTAASRQPPC